MKQLYEENDFTNSVEDTESKNTKTELNSLSTSKKYNHHQDQEPSVNNENTERDIIEAQNEENDVYEIGKIPQNLKKTFVLCLVLLIIGLLLFLVGGIFAIVTKIVSKGFTFWILGGIVIIPGGYYTFQFYKLIKAKDEYQRGEIIDNIPEL